MTEQYQPIATCWIASALRWRRLAAFERHPRRARRDWWHSRCVLLLAMLTTRSPDGAGGACGGGGRADRRRGASGVCCRCGETPSDRRIARFIEERTTELDERLVSAVGVAAAERPPRIRSDEPDPAPGLPIDGSRRGARGGRRSIPRRSSPREVLRRPAMQAAAAVLLLVAVGLLARDTARQSFDAWRWRCSRRNRPRRDTRQRARPGRVGLAVRRDWSATARRSSRSCCGPMAPPTISGAHRKCPATPTAQFALSLSGLNASFRYRVVGRIGDVDDVFDVAVVRPPRVDAHRRRVHVSARAWASSRGSKRTAATFTRRPARTSASGCTPIARRRPAR